MSMPSSRQRMREVLNNGRKAMSIQSGDGGRPWLARRGESGSEVRGA